MTNGNSGQAQGRSAWLVLLLDRAALGTVRA